MNDEKRFDYRPFSQSIYDRLTGEFYQGNDKTCNLLNELNNRADKNAEKFFELLSVGGVDPVEYQKFIKLMNKYEVSSVEKLDQMLFNQKRC